MLYLWPFFMLFSIPLLYPYILKILLKSVLPPVFDTIPISNYVPRLIVAFPIMATMLAVAYYNTLVHPFTLADNRHYTFYIFRILLRHPAIKYFAVPIYFLCAWVAITALGSKNAQTPPLKSQPTPKKLQKQRGQAAATSRPSPTSGPKVSFLLVWLLATTASLVTTPLVEPRYFIVPWLMWRLHVAPLRPGNLTITKSRKNRINNLLEKLIYCSHDHRLWLETAWFLAINTATAYIFLNWGFEWPQEPGLVQRFMW